MAMKIDNKNLEWVVSLWKIWPFLDENTPKALSYKEIHNLLNSCNCCSNNAIAYLKKVEIIETTEGSNTSFILSSTSVEVIHEMNIPITYSVSKMNTDTSISRESNWTSFRKMVKYYIDCIAIDSDYSTRLNAKYLNNKFCFMN